MTQKRDVFVGQSRKNGDEVVTDRSHHHAAMMHSLWLACVRLGGGFLSAPEGDQLNMFGKSSRKWKCVLNRFCLTGHQSKCSFAEILWKWTVLLAYLLCSSVVFAIPQSVFAGFDVNVMFTYCRFILDGSLGVKT